jgi:hypothetical protein
VYFLSVLATCKDRVESNHSLKCQEGLTTNTLPTSSNSTGTSNSTEVDKKIPTATTTTKTGEALAGQELPAKDAASDKKEKKSVTFSPHLLWSKGSTDSLGLGASSEEKAKQCQPCDARPELGPTVFIRNSTRDLLDPVDGPLAVGSKHADTSCPSCPAPDIIMTFVDDNCLDTLSVWLHYYKPLDHSHRILSLFALSDTSFWSGCTITSLLIIHIVSYIYLRCQIRRFVK